MEEKSAVGSKKRNVPVRLPKHRTHRLAPAKHLKVPDLLPLKRKNRQLPGAVGDPQRGYFRSVAKTGYSEVAILKDHAFIGSKEFMVKRHVKHFRSIASFLRWRRGCRIIRA
jgi:hypothetical protein